MTYEYSIFLYDTVLCYVIKDSVIKANNLKGNTTSDYKIASEKSGYNVKNDGYTWHHFEDGKTMGLIPSDLHDYFRHTGGESIIKNGYKGVFGSGKTTDPFSNYSNYSNYLHQLER